MGLAEKLVPRLIIHVYESAQKYLPSMLTEKQIEDQQEFERKQISGGLQSSALIPFRGERYASANVYGSAFVKSNKG